MEFIAYLITVAPDDAKFIEAINSIKQDIENKQNIKQCFFYSDASKIISNVINTDSVTKEKTEGKTELMLIELQKLANQHSFRLSVCAAAFKARNYQLVSSDDIVDNDNFDFISLAQFISQTIDAKVIRAF